MKYLISLALLLTFAIPAYAADSLATRLAGKILLQVESYGRAWYVNPTDGERYYLKDGPTAYEFMRTMGLGITNADLARIPEQEGDYADTKLVNRLLGRILLQVESHGEAWYVNPDDGLRYYMKDGDAAYNLMRYFSLGISNTDLATIPMNDTQLVHDTTFDDVAYVKISNGSVVAEKNANQILPPASMTKLMTALVLLDQNINFDKEVTILENHINYPRYYAGSDATSEIDLQAGDIVTIRDLFTALLVASSNQAAVAISDASGLSRNEFVTAMNDKAEELGLERTIFYDPSGLTAHTVTTAREMAKIAEVAFNNPEITSTSRLGTYTITTKNYPSREIKVVDRNYTLAPYNPVGVKTGFLDEAQRCVSMKVGDDIIVVMHARSMSERNKILDQLTGN